MPRKVPVVVALVVSAMVASTAGAQMRLARPVAISASAAGAHLVGVVRDDAGRSVIGVSILALGTTLGAAETDSTGRYALFLPIGDYVVRAVRDGYVSTFRETVRVQNSATIERDITLTRAAGSGLPAAPAGDDAAAHSERAWRLRHLPRTVLRDEGFGDSVATNESRPRSAAATFLPDLSGEINLLTTASARPALGTAAPAVVPHSVADVALGTSGLRGDWTVRAAMTATDLPSWTLAGEYSGDADRQHVLRAGASYSAQMFATGDEVRFGGGAAPGQRAVGEVYGSDLWHVNPRVDLDYGVRLDRYDYLDQPDLASERAAIRLRVFPALYLTAGASHRMAAPGADQFLPPSDAGPWLPPERTFESLVSGDALLPERVQRGEVGIEREITPTLVAGVHWFSEQTTGQLATLFDPGAAGAFAHYYVASPGDVFTRGWTLGLSGHLARHVRGRIDYASAAAAWMSPERAAALWAAMPQAARPFAGRLHDVQATVDADLPATSTRVTVAYRLDTAFSGSSPDATGSRPGNRFSVVLRQALPCRMTGGSLQVFVALRTLLHDNASAVSFYDELLTVSPPVRLTVGLQMGF